MIKIQNRRELLRTAVAAAGFAVAGGIVLNGSRTADGKSADEDEGEVTPGEDLMQEHGVLERILLIYDEAAHRLDRHESLDLSVVARAARMIRTFVEDYHEKNEEEFVFPRLQKAHREADLIAVLLRQHQRGRELTDEIVRGAAGTAHAALAKRLRAFNAMYRPHAAREDTVLFPSFREVMGPKGYRELGETFEDRERQLFGKGGFGRIVGEVADLERALTIYDLANFTPA